MPVSGPVYQPTTVTYQQQHSSRWNCPMSYFTQRLHNNLNKPKCIKLAMCVVGFIVFVAGLAMVIDGSVHYGREGIQQLNNTDSAEPQDPSASDQGRLGVIVTGCVLLIIGALFAGGFAYSLRGGSRTSGSGGLGGGGGGGGGQRASWLVRAWHRRTGNNASGGGGTPLGPAPAACPSTDPLVHAAQPPANDDERRNLMDNKDCLSSAEESDKMLDSEPRVTIVTGA